MHLLVISHLSSSVRACSARCAAARWRVGSEAPPAASLKMREPTNLNRVSVHLVLQTRMATPSFEDACRACDAASANGTNFVTSFRNLASICKDIGNEAVAAKAKDLLRIILCSAPMCSTASRVKAVRSVAICVLESGPAAASLLSTGLIKGSSIYAHKSHPRPLMPLSATPLTVLQLRWSRPVLATQVRCKFGYAKYPCSKDLIFTQLPSSRLLTCIPTFGQTWAPRTSSFN